MKQNSVIKNTMILFISMAITKILGAVLKIPLANTLGGIGMGYFSTAYTLFSPIYSFLSAGIPIAVTKMTAQCIACKKQHEILPIKSCAIRISLFTGIMGTVAVFILAVPFSVYIAGSAENIPSVLAIAPSVVFCCIAAAYKGYYEGMSDMTPTAVSQIVESAVKAVIGLLLANMVLSALISRGSTFEAALPYAAAGAVLGITIGEFFGTAYLIIHDRFKNQKGEKCSTVITGKKTFVKRIILEALPISINAIVININSFLDLLTISSGINSCFANNEAFFRKTYGTTVFTSINISDFGTFVYGSYTGITLTLFMMISSMTALIGKSTLPKIAELWQRGCKENISRCVKALLFSVFALGIPLSFALGAFSEPVLRLLYSSRPAEIEICINQLRIIGFGGIGISIIGVSFAIFQAIGKSYIPVKLMLMIAGIKIVGNLTLFSIPELCIDAAAISTVVSHSVAAIAGYLLLKKYIGNSIKAGRDLLLTILSAGAASFAGLFVYNYNENTESISIFMLSIVVFTATYCILMALFFRKKLTLAIKNFCKKRK